MKRIVYIVGGLYQPSGMGEVMSCKVNYLAEHTEEILAQYGYTDEEISKMIEDGAAVSMDPALRD